MAIWMILVLIGMICLMNIVCFYIGAKIGQKVVKNEPLIIKTPMEAVKEKIEDRAYKREQEKQDELIDTIQHNIDIYDGTTIGQKDLPR